MKLIGPRVFILSAFILLVFGMKGQSTTDTSLVRVNDFKLVPSLDLTFSLPHSDELEAKPIKSIFDANKLPIFCKFEHQLKQKTNINLRMRLGSLDYVNKLEGKN